MEGEEMKPKTVEPPNPEICACPISQRGKPVGEDEHGDKIYHCKRHGTVELEPEINKHLTLERKP